MSLCFTVRRPNMTYGGPNALTTILCENRMTVEDRGLMSRLLKSKDFLGVFPVRKFRTSGFWVIGVRYFYIIDSLMAQKLLLTTEGF